MAEDELSRRRRMLRAEGIGYHPDTPPIAEKRPVDVGVFQPDALKTPMTRTMQEPRPHFDDAAARARNEITYNTEEQDEDMREVFGKGQ